MRLETNLQPTLAGQWVRLRPLRDADFAPLYAVAADPAIWQQHPVRDRYREDVFRVFFREALDSGGALVAVDAASGVVIGTSRFHGYDPLARVLEIGWTFLARSHWGGRWNGEMKQLMRRHAFGFVDSVIFVVDPKNLRSQRAVEKIGGRRSGSRVGPEGVEKWVFEIGRSRFT
jgi:RimJ/RimL family protein N-acetyltransferase